MCAGIDESNYNALDPLENQREDPVRRWRVVEGDQVEVWPLPATSGNLLRFCGTKTLRPLLPTRTRATWTTI